MEAYQRALSHRILEKLDPSKLSLLDISWGIVEKGDSVSVKNKKEGLPLIDPSLASQLMMPIVVVVVGKVIGELVWKMIERRGISRSRNDIVKITISNKKNIKKRTVEICLEKGIKKGKTSTIVEQIFLSIADDQDILKTPENASRLE